MALCLEEMKKYVKPGITTYELDQICEKLIIENDGIPACKGYEGFPCTICASVNEVVVHGIPSKHKKLRNGDIVTVDLVVGTRDIMEIQLILIKLEKYQKIKKSF